jgi:arylsulfatase A-like enzyme
MSRYLFSIVIVLFMVSGVSRAETKPTLKPNILILLSDDHSYPFVGCYGDTNVKTPTLDKLASEGMRFHRYFTSCPQCVPSRAALMTGRSPVAARMTRFSAPLPADEIAFPELLRSQGNYYTGICGRSFHLDGSNPKAVHEEDLLAKLNMRTFKDRVDFLQGAGDAAVASTFASFLDAKPEGKPFFMWANFSDPHHAWNAPSEFRPDPKSLKVPAHFPDLPGTREQLADYCAEVNRLDTSVASVLKVLTDRGMLDSTIIVFAGDNGMAMPHGKGSLYDPGSNVPLIVRGPGIKKIGSETSHLISGEDIAPTLLEAAGLKPGAKMSGVSFWPLLVGEAYTPRKYVFVERGPHGSGPVTQDIKSSTYDLSRSVRSDRFKFIYNCTPWIPYSPVDSAQGALWNETTAAHQAGSLDQKLSQTYFSSPRPVYELYDLDSDPSELTNLAGQEKFAEVQDELRVALIEKMIVDFDYLPLPGKSVMGPNEGKPRQGKKNSKKLSSR